MPREVFTEYAQYPHHILFSDRFVVAVDANNQDVGDTISLEQLSTMPYQASSCGHEISTAEAQQDRLGIERNTEVTTAFGLAPLLLRETRRIAVIHERLALAMAGEADLRLLESPVEMEPITEVAIWPSRSDADPAPMAQASRLPPRERTRRHVPAPTTSRSVIRPAPCGIGQCQLSCHEGASGD